MPEDAWNSEWVRAMGIMLNGQTLHTSDAEGNPLTDDSFLLLVNAAHEGVDFTLPVVPNGTPWRQIMDTENIDDPFAEAEVGEKVIVAGRSLMLFCDYSQREKRAAAKE